MQQHGRSQIAPGVADLKRGALFDIRPHLTDIAVPLAAPDPVGIAANGELVGKSVDSQALHRFALVAGGHPRGSTTPPREGFGVEAIGGLVVQIRSETDTLAKVNRSGAPLDRIVAKAVFQMVQAIALIAKLFRPEIFLDRGETIFDGAGLLAAVGIAVLHRLVIGGIVLGQRLDRGQTGINLTQAGLDRGDPIVLLRRQFPLFAELGTKGPGLRLERFPLGA